jgi:pimeloyl-ACP methyl ester carboxylesterase
VSPDGSDARRGASSGPGTSVGGPDPYRAAGSDAHPGPGTSVGAARFPTTTLSYPGGLVEYGVAGAALTEAHEAYAPSTLFLHGLAGSLEDVRPLASGVRGRKVFANLPGHGRSTGPDPLSYATLAAAARAVADHENVTAALGVSLGAATLLRLIADTPDRFERVVLYLPAVADVPRAPGAVSVHRTLAERLAAGDGPGVAEALLLTQPSAARATPLLRDWADRRARELLAEGGDARRWLPLADAVPLGEVLPPGEAGESADRDGSGGSAASGSAGSGSAGSGDSSGPGTIPALAAVKTPVLVIAQQGDPAHPVPVAERLAAAFPSSDLKVFGPEGALWGHRKELRALIAPFLTPDLPRGQ